MNARDVHAIEHHDVRTRSGCGNTPSGGADVARCPGEGILAELPPAEQEVLLLSCFYGLVRDEIAELIGASVELVDALTASAIQQLRRRLVGQQAA